MAGEKSVKSQEIKQGDLAVITGAAGGIGLEFAKHLSFAGYPLLLVDLDGERLTTALAEIKDYLKASQKPVPDIHLLVLDLCQQDAVGVLDRYCSENNLVPSILINNAGIFSFLPVVDTNEGKLNLFVDLHVRAVTLLSRWFCDICKRQGRGWLLNMSSMSCWMPMPGLAMYASTKSYIRVFSRSLGYEMKDHGVKVMVACPGGIATDLFGLPDNLKKLAVGLGVLDTPEKFVMKAVKKMFKGKSQYINGLLNRFSIVFIGSMPTAVRMLVKHKLLDKGIRR